MSRPDKPELVDVIRAWIEQHDQDSHTCLIARVQRYDAATQTADLVPVVRHAVEQPDGSSAYEDLPVLPHVPIACPRAGAWFLALPIAAGDFVVVHVLDASSEHWRAGDGAAQYPGDLRRRTLGSVVAYPANFYPRGAALDNASATDLVLGKDDGSRITIKPDGTIELAGNAAFVALASLVDDRLAKLQNAFDTHLHAVSGANTLTPTPVPGVIPVGTLASVAAQKVKAT